MNGSEKENFRTHRFSNLVEASFSDVVKALSDGKRVRRGIGLKAPRSSWLRGGM